MASLPTLSIAVLADRSGVDVETLKTYERLGLLPRPRRTDGLRLYPPEEVERVILADSALGLGFSLAAVRQLLGAGRRGRLGCDDVYAIAERHLADVRRRRADLERIERLLQPLVETCPREGLAGRCNIIGALSHRRKVGDTARN